MSVSKVFYKEVDEKISDSINMMELYYQFNLNQFSDKVREVYEDYAGRFIQEKNMEIHIALRRDGIERWPKLGSTIFGLSGLKNKPVLIAEY